VWESLGCPSWDLPAVLSSWTTASGMGGGGGGEGGGWGGGGLRLEIALCGMKNAGECSGTRAERK